VLLHASRLGAPSTLRGLVDLTRRVAAEVHAGLHPVEVDPTKRWYRRLHGDDYLDVWLIGWATEQATELHDHAGSLGALTVVSGGLVEHRWSQRSRRLLSRRLPAARSVSFAPGHVHDVTNRAAAPAVSVHAYSPPLTAMSYYAVEPPGRLRRTRTVLTEVTPG
jgi:predicted metal-dependent enzyme (double-stranded beta helix superfamily)